MRYSIMQTAFPAPASITQEIINLQVAAWNRTVGPRSRFLRFEARAAVFLHPTKGFRRVSKGRLGL